MNASTARRWPNPAKIGLLSMLYLAQGLPFGFQANALALYLTDLGLSLEKISFARALALPWSLKALWAPFVDRHGSETFGRRKSWIVPMQLLLAGTCFVASWVPPASNLTLLLCLVLLMNFFAATQDIAVDGLAVDLLGENELGAGNAAQVVGYKIGMLTGGGLLVWASAYLGWSFMFQAMGALCLIIALIMVRHRERPHERHGETTATRVHWPELKARLLSIFKAKGALTFFAFVATYKAGESMADAMFGPWLVREAHLPKETVSLWLGSYGLIGSLLGSFSGGWLATRMPLLRAIGITAFLRSIPLFLQAALVAGAFAAGPSSVIPLTVLEHAFGGMLTTCMFAYMMSRVDQRIGATHYTVIASVEVLGKAPPAFLSGTIAQTFGFVPLFVASGVLSLAFLFLVAAEQRNFSARSHAVSHE